MRAPWTRIRTGILVLLVLLAVRNLVLYARETRKYPPHWANYFSALGWLNRNCPRDAVIIDRKPGFVEFVTDRKALAFPRESEPTRMLDRFRRDRVTHVVVAHLPFDDIQRYLVPAVVGERSHFRLIHRTPKPRTYIFEFHPEGGVTATETGEPRGLPE